MFQTTNQLIIVIIAIMNSNHNNSNDSYKTRYIHTIVKNILIII